MVLVVQHQQQQGSISVRPKAKASGVAESGRSSGSSSSKKGRAWGEKELKSGKTSGKDKVSRWARLTLKMTSAAIPLLPLRAVLVAHLRLSLTQETPLSFEVSPLSYPVSTTSREQLRVSLPLSVFLTRT